MSVTEVFPDFFAVPTVAVYETVAAPGAKVPGVTDTVQATGVRPPLHAAGDVTPAALCFFSVKVTLIANEAPWLHVIVPETLGELPPTPVGSTVTAAIHGGLSSKAPISQADP